MEAVARFVAEHIVADTVAQNQDLLARNQEVPSWAAPSWAAAPSLTLAVPCQKTAVRKSLHQKKGAGSRSYKIAEAALEVVALEVAVHLVAQVQFATLFLFRRREKTSERKKRFVLKFEISPKQIGCNK